MENECRLAYVTAMSSEGPFEVFEKLKIVIANCPFVFMSGTPLAVRTMSRF